MTNITIKTALKTFNLEMAILLMIKDIKDKDKAADYVSYTHMSLMVNSIASFWYTHWTLHYLNITIQLFTYLDWFQNASVVQHGGKDECILTRVENTIRSEAVRERNYDKKALEVKEKPKLKNGYIKTVIYNNLGYIVPENSVNIVIHSMVAVSLYNSWSY